MTLFRIIPNSDFAISTRSAFGFESFAMTLPFFVIKISSVSARVKYLPKFILSSVAVITRNKKDYAKSNVPIISADEFIELLKDELNTI